MELKSNSRESLSLPKAQARADETARSSVVFSNANDRRFNSKTIPHEVLGSGVNEKNELPQRVVRCNCTSLSAALPRLFRFLLPPVTSSKTAATVSLEKILRRRVLENIWLRGIFPGARLSNRAEATNWSERR